MFVTFTAASPIISHARELRGAGLGRVRRDGAHRHARRGAGGVPGAGPGHARPGRRGVRPGDAARRGTQVRADPAELITGRAALAGFTRGGRVSAGGSSFLLRSADGWCAVTLSRPDDVAAVPGDRRRARRGRSQPGRDRDAGERRAPRSRWRPGARRPTDFAAAAQLVGVPRRAALPRGVPPPATAADARAARHRPAGRRGGPRASRHRWPAHGWPARWSLTCRRCGRARSARGCSAWRARRSSRSSRRARPDGARSGNREFFDWLHAGHRSLSADFGTRAGRAVLASLLEVADVVIEASRPRALAALGLAPDMIPHRPARSGSASPGTGGRLPDRVAFGDDAAVAGGLVGWADGRAQRRSRSSAPTRSPTRWPAPAARSRSRCRGRPAAAS